MLSKLYLERPMLKQGIKNYFKNLKHFFTPLGAMFLGLVFGLSVLIPVLSTAFRELAEGVNALSHEFNVDFNQLFQSLFDSVSALDWSDPWAALQTMTSDGWLEDVIYKSLEALLGVDYQTFIDEIALLIGTFSAQVLVGFTILAVFFVLGIIGGYYLTAYLVRRSIARRAWWKFFLAYLIDLVVNFALVALGVWLTLLWKYSAIIFLLVAFVLSGLVALLVAYLIQGYKKVSLQEVVNLKNAVQFMLSTLIVWLITFALCVVVKVITNDLVAIVVAIALFEIAIPVNKLNAEAYVKQLADGKQSGDAAVQPEQSSVEQAEQTDTSAQPDEGAQPNDSAANESSDSADAPPTEDSAQTQK